MWKNNQASPVTCDKPQQNSKNQIMLEPNLSSVRLIKIHHDLLGLCYQSSSVFSDFPPDWGWQITFTDTFEVSHATCEETIIIMTACYGEVLMWDFPVTAATKNILKLNMAAALMTQTHMLSYPVDHTHHGQCLCVCHSELALYLLHFTECGYRGLCNMVQVSLSPAPHLVGDHRQSQARGVVSFVQCALW